MDVGDGEDLVGDGLGDAFEVGGGVAQAADRGAAAGVEDRAAGGEGEG